MNQYLEAGENQKNGFFSYLIENWISSTVVEQYLLKL